MPQKSFSPERGKEAGKFSLLARPLLLSLDKFLVLALTTSQLTLFF
jgi:hypothetical protein